MAISQDTINALHQNYLSSIPAPQTSKTVTTQKKGNLFTNLLPAIGGGLGAVAGIPLDIFGGAGSIAGAAGGSALGEALKEKLTGQNLSAKQIGIQGLEGGALGAVGGVARGASSLAKGVVAAGADTTDKVATEGGSTVAKNLVTQGQQAQGRVAGVSAGSKIAGKELTPQDTTTMLNTLKSEGINTGNANNALRDIQGKLSQYGKQIGDYFTANNTPLNPADTKTIAANYLSGLKTTDPAVLKQASVVANDLEKNVTDTKSLWEFRKGLDSKIPDAKFGTDEATTAKVTALKDMRQFVNGQLGDVPGSTNYHALSEVKPFISAEAKRLNNPSGGIAGRIFASGPAQKIESSIGKATEKAGQKIAGSSVPPTDDLAGAIQQASGNSADQAVTQEAASLPSTSRAAQALATLKGTATLPARAAVAPIAYPGKSLVQVGKQEVGRAIGDVVSNLPSSSSQPASPQQPATDLTSALMQAQQPDQSQPQSQSPYTQDDLQYDIQRDPTNSSKYIDYYNSLAKIYTPATPAATSSKPTAQQFGLANSGVQSLQELAQAIQSNPNIVNKNATPGQGLPVVGSLVSSVAGDSGYHALADNILQAIIHLQTGATATTSEVKAAEGQLPQPGNSPAVQQQKLQTLLSDFAPFLGGTQ